MKENIREITVHSSLDNSPQPSLLFMPETEKSIPLVVGLHTWSYDRFNKVNDYLPFCKKYGWALLLPEFRGPNLRSNPHGREACGSELAQQDILDALDHVLKTERIAPGRVFLLGASGGGHAALLTAVRSPDRWRGSGQRLDGMAYLLRQRKQLCGRTRTLSRRLPGRTPGTIPKTLSGQLCENVVPSAALHSSGTA